MATCHSVIHGTVNESCFMLIVVAALSRRYPVVTDVQVFPVLAFTTVRVSNTTHFLGILKSRPLETSCTI